MIRGIANFTKHFENYKDDYVVIGGLATAMIMNDLGFVARATKDIDLVVVSNNNEKFIKKLLEFIELAGYKTKQRTNNDSKHNLFRFFDSEDKTYPEQIELFAIHDENSPIFTDKHIIPIKTPDSYKYLSAILLDADYFNLLIEHTTNIDGLHVATPEVLIPLKIHAHLNLIEAKHSDANKHLTDIIRLITFLDDEDSVVLNGEPKNDFIKFLPIIEDIEEDRIRSILKSSNISNISKGTIIELLRLVYKINPTFNS